MLNIPWPSFALELPNQGSVARDHLAITQLFQIRSLVTDEPEEKLVVKLNNPGNHEDPKFNDFVVGRAMGLAFIVLSIAVLGIGTLRYFKTQRLMTRGVFSASRGTILFCSLTAVALFICLLAIIMRKALGDD
ncbi:hypothetical protein H4R33_001788 [Dimargaris cristalligena]|nr:hypothetical protein H4R33_001788 [Dimargaris cristalligena]